MERQQRPKTDMLCIGGPRDGHYIRADAQMEYFFCPASESATEDVVYRRETWGCEPEEQAIDFWLLEGLSTHDAMRRLIQYYSPPQKH